MINPYADEDRAALYMVADMVRNDYVGKTLHIEQRIDVDHFWEYTGKVTSVLFEDGTFVNYGALTHANLDIT